MTTRRSPELRPRDGLRPRLEALCHDAAAGPRLAADPVAFPRRYADPRDAELAAVIAASFAYGRVDLFRPVIAGVLAHADARGGPAAYARHFDPARDGPALLPLVYRWNRGIDVVLLWSALRRAQALGGLEALTGGQRAGEADIAPALARLVEALRSAMVDAAPACGLAVERFGELPRGARMMLPSPRDGSACKRWLMFMRWMIRPDDGVDLGLWRSLSPRALLIPLDVHVSRIARLVGLTDRRDASLRTSREVTAALREFDPEDPVRFDFALAHLGISGRCTGAWQPDACPSCLLYPSCVAASAGGLASAGSGAA